MTCKKPTTAAEKDAARQVAQDITAELMQRVSDRIEVLADAAPAGRKRRPAGLSALLWPFPLLQRQ